MKCKYCGNEVRSFINKYRKKDYIHQNGLFSCPGVGFVADVYELEDYIEEINLAISDSKSKES